MTERPDQPAPEPGCWIDSQHGRYMLPMICRTAEAYGWTPAEDDQKIIEAAEGGDDPEWISELVDEAELWLNENIADDIHYFGTHPDGGGFGYWIIEEAAADILKDMSGTLKDLESIRDRRRRWCQGMIEAGWTQQDLAEMLEMTQQRISQILNA